MKEKPGNHSMELIFHNIHDHGTDIGDMWMAEIEKRSGGKVAFSTTIGDDPDLLRPGRGVQYPAG